MAGVAVGGAGSGSLRIAVVGGGPAGSFFVLYALKYARAAGRDVSITIYEGKEFSSLGPAGCNMCAGIVPVSELGQFRDLDLAVPPELILSRVSSYSLHTSACELHATQPDSLAEIISVYRGSGPRRGPSLGPVSFDEMLIQEAVSRGAVVRRAFVDAIRRGEGVEIASGGESERYDLVVLAGGVNGHSMRLEGLDYQPPPTDIMCQTELLLGHEEVQDRLGSAVHIFLPPDEIASYGILIPKGPYVTASLLGPRHQMLSMHRFLDIDEVKRLVGTDARRACGCMPRISIGPAANVAADGFVAIGDASATRLYKNGIGSALATAERAAWTAIYRGCRRSDFAASYLPLCRAIDNDNRIGRLLFLQVPAMKRFGAMTRAHCQLAMGGRQADGVAALHARILWGMFTGAYSYRDLFRMALSPRLLMHMAVALGRSLVQGRA